jgi:L-asparagine transporter-like permease
VIHKSISDLDHRTGVPKIAILIVAAISMVVVISAGLVFERLYPNQPFNALTYASLFLLILESPISYMIHILTNTSLYRFLKKNNKKVSIVKHVLIPAISTVTLLFAIFVAVYFNLSAPYIYGVYGALVWVVAIIGLTLYVSLKRKDKLELIGDFSL